MLHIDFQLSTSYAEEADGILIVIRGSTTRARASFVETCSVTKAMRNANRISTRLRIHSWVYCCLLLAYIEASEGV